jgi:DNA replicative helicase MCM subunit Mcm2 (Cdc46/Mcm family)
VTIETRTTVDPQDIKAIEFECNACHSRVLHPIEKFRQPPTRCVTCDSSQWLIVGGSEWEDLLKFVRIIQNLHKSENMGFKIHFQITQPKP